MFARVDNSLAQYTTPSPLFSINESAVEVRVCFAFIPIGWREPGLHSKQVASILLEFGQFQAFFSLPYLPKGMKKNSLFLACDYTCPHQLICLVHQMLRLQFHLQVFHIVSGKLCWPVRLFEFQLRFKKNFDVKFFAFWCNVSGRVCFCM